MPTTATSTPTPAPGREGLVRIYPRKLGKLKVVEPVVLTRESLCAMTKLNEDDLAKLLLGAKFSVVERASNRHIACLGPYAHANRIWIRGETHIVTTTGIVQPWRAYSEHIAFVDSRYSGPDCRATKLRAIAHARADALNAAASGDLDLLIAVLNDRPECSVMPVPHGSEAAEDLAQAA